MPAWWPIGGPHPSIPLPPTSGKGQVQVAVGGKEEKEGEFRGDRRRQRMEVNGDEKTIKKDDEFSRK